MNPQVKTSVNDSTEISQGGGMIRPFINDRLNSQINEKLPEGLWRVKWKSPLLKGLNPNFILQYGDRIVLQGIQTWQLFDTSGKQINANSFSFSDVIIDPGNKLIYCTDNKSILHAYNLNDGEISFILDDIYGVKYNRQFITRFDSTFLSLSNELILDPHSSENPEISYIETQNIGSSPQVDNLKILTANKRERLEKRKSGTAIAAANENLFVVAYEDHVEYLDRSLNVINKFEDKFVPLLISLDENSRVYLITKTKELPNRTGLWIIDSYGSLISKTAINLLHPDYLTPPVINSNHIVYIRYENRITAIDSAGNILWEQSTKKPLAGIIAADNLLIAAEGSILTAFDEKGERRFVYNFEEEELTTAPILTNNGEILVGTKKFLYCLKIKDD